jgi:hypothetical protein
MMIRGESSKMKTKELDHTLGEEPEMTKLPSALVSQLTEREPILSKKSDIFGKVDLYEPDTPPDMWGSEPWYLLTETSDDGNPLQYKLKPDFAFSAYDRPYFITDAYLFTSLPSVSTKTLDADDLV